MKVRYNNIYIYRSLSFVLSSLLLLTLVFNGGVAYAKARRVTILPNPKAFCSNILKQEGIYSTQTLTLLLHCIGSESGGNTNCVYGTCVGVLQFNSKWGTFSNRLNATWSVKQWCRVWKASGVRGIRKHWCKSHNCRRGINRARAWLRQA